jgi:predicted restriction endonuclease
LSKGVWYINQCDSCVHCRYQKDDNYKEDSYYWCGFHNLNPEKEVNKLCKYFEIKIIKSYYSENEIYNSALNSYFYKNHLPYTGRETYLNLPLDEKRKKCIELNIIKDSDFKLISNDEYIKNNLSNLLLDDEDFNLRDTEEYLLWQKEVFKRDGYKCQICGSNKKINAHHLDSFSRYPDLRYIIDNGITLCDEHHNTKCDGSFHNIYGTRSFTKDDFIIYKNNKIRELKTING